MYSYKDGTKDNERGKGQTAEVQLEQIQARQNTVVLSLSVNNGAWLEAFMSACTSAMTTSTVIV